MIEAYYKRKNFEHLMCPQLSHINNNSSQYINM